MTQTLHPIEPRSESVDIVVPLLIEALRPRSVVDLGCNSAAWLSGFVDAGVDDVIGVDAPYLVNETLFIEKDRFVAFDLESDDRLDLGRRFDLALCLECAEHLEASAAQTLVDRLCALADHVAFSAAIPGQTGVGHKNEQYPDYWRDLFAKRGYRPFDLFRRAIWNDARVEFWYRQNLLVYSKNPAAIRVPATPWDGSVFVAKELLEIYVRELGTQNADSLVSTEYLVRTTRQRGFDVRPAKPSWRDRVAFRLRRLTGR